MKNESDRKRNRFGTSFENMLEAMPSGCLEWRGAVDKNGYGRRGSRYGETRAHRYAYVQKYGEIPRGVVVRHTCDNPPCCNPDHLVIGTDADNVQDKVSKGRQALGRKVRTSVATEAMILEIRSAWGQGETQVSLAAQFGLDQTTISQIVRRKTWKHL